MGKYNGAITVPAFESDVEYSREELGDPAKCNIIKEN